MHASAADDSTLQATRDGAVDLYRGDQRDPKIPSSDIPRDVEGIDGQSGGITSLPTLGAFDESAIDKSCGTQTELVGPMCTTPADGKEVVGETEKKSRRTYEKALNERLRAVERYLRDEDPPFVRENLELLLQGELAQLDKGDIVEVARRCRGEMKEGGLGTVLRVLPDIFYDIKYSVSGVEKGVDGCFVRRVTLGQGSRRTNERCKGCFSFVTECTCWQAWPGSCRAHGSRCRDHDRWEHEPTRGLKERKGVGLGKEKRLREDSGRGGRRWRHGEGERQGVGEDRGFFNRDQGEAAAATAPRSLAEGQASAPASDAARCGGHISPSRLDAAGDHGHVTAIKQWAEEGTENCWEEEVEEEDRALQGSMGAADLSLESGLGEKNERGAKRGAAGGTAPSVEVGQGTGGLGEEKRGQQATDSNFDNPVENSEAGDSSGGGNGVGGGEGGGREGDASGFEGRGKQQEPYKQNEFLGEEQGGHGEQGTGAGTVAWQPRVGDLVEVERRLGSGQRQFGGVGRIIRVSPGPEGRVDVRYHVERVRERGIDPRHIQPTNLGQGQGG
ncbi:unnamed protein product, partial [Discosporangium mesarthrocarpum]